MRGISLAALVGLLSSAVLLGNTERADASLIGDQICADAQWTNAPGGATPLLSGSCATVDIAATEFSVPIPGLGGSEFLIDFLSDTSFRIEFNPADFALWPTQIDVQLTDLDWVDGPGAVTSVTQTDSNATGFLSNISFTADSITLLSDIDNIDTGASFFADFSFTADHDGGQIDLPEPGTLGLFGLSLAVLGFATRRRRSAVSVR